LRIDAFEGFGVLDGAIAGVADGLGAAAAGEIGDVFPEMLLGFHGFDGSALDVEDGGDIEKDLRFEIALLGLVGFEDEDGRRFEWLAFGGVAKGLRVDAGAQGDFVGGGVIGIIGIAGGVGEDEFGLECAEFGDESVEELGRGEERIIAGIEKADFGAEEIGGGLRFVAAELLDLIDRHAGLFPGTLAFTALAEGEAENADAIAAGDVEGDGAGGSPDEIGGVGGDDGDGFGHLETGYRGQRAEGRGSEARGQGRKEEGAQHGFESGRAGDGTFFVDGAIALKRKEACAGFFENDADGGEIPGLDLGLDPGVDFTGGEHDGVGSSAEAAHRPELLSPIDQARREFH